MATILLTLEIYMIKFKLKMQMQMICNKEEKYEFKKKYFIHIDNNHALY